MGFVGSELRDKSVRARKAPHVTQPLDEFHLDRRPVQLRVRVEQMRFERQRGVAEGWARAEVHHAAIRAAGGLHHDSVYPLRGQKLPRVWGAEVDGRVAE